MKKENNNNNAKNTKEVKEVKDSVKEVTPTQVEKKVETVAPVAPVNKPVFNPVAALVEHCKNMNEVMESKKSINFVIGSDGEVYEIRKNAIGVFALKAEKVLGGDNIKEGFQWKLPKMPFDILLEIVSFFKAVCDQFNDDEAVVQIFYNKTEKKYFTICLEQTTNKVAVKFLRNKDLEKNEDVELVMDIHSHNTMDAFFSGTDNRDEKETRLFGVFGKLKNSRPAYKFRMGIAGRFKELSISDLFEMPKMIMKFGEKEVEFPVNEDSLMFPTVDFPAEWLEIVKKGKAEKDKFYKSQPASVGRHSFDWEENNFGKERLINYQGSGTIGTTGRVIRPVEQMSLLDKEVAHAEANSVRKPFAQTIAEKTQQRKALKEEMDGFIYNEEDELDRDTPPLAYDDVEDLAIQASDLGVFDFKRFVDLLLDQGCDDQIIEMLKERGYRVY